MEPWIAILIIFGFIIFVVIIAVVMLIVAGKNSSQGGASKRILDLSNFKSHGRISVYVPHRDFLTHDWYISTQNSDKALYREAGIFKKPMRELNLKDMMTLTDTETGFSLIVNGASNLNIPILSENREIKRKLEQEKSKNSELKAENIVLRKHVDKKVLEEIENVGSLHQKVAPIFVKPQSRSSH
jgi:hypothetical protein